MREVLTWGSEIRDQFERLGITPVCIYVGAGEAPSVYAFKDDDFATLDADPHENWEGKDAIWRTVDRQGPMSKVTVNGRSMIGWTKNWHLLAGSDDGPYTGPWHSLLEHIAETAGATSPGHMTACAATLAVANGCTIGQLFARYQPQEADIFKQGPPN